jgi:hypothetical protein
MRTSSALEPISDELIARLRAAAAAASPSQARTWLPVPGPATRLLQAVVRAIQAQPPGWYLHA